MPKTPEAPVSMISAQMAAAQQRPGTRRGPSMQWGRLKPAAVDPLDAYGLPSKGETRLHDFRTQESYYNKIVERYMKFCAASGGGDALDKHFAALSYSDPTAAPLTNVSVTPSPKDPGSANLRSTSNRPLNRRNDSSLLSPDTAAAAAPATSTRNPTVELSLILHSMRKLREAMSASRRTDRFAQRAYIFIVHAAILTKSWESYVPALDYLFRHIHPTTPLPPSEYNEFAGYHILDVACRLNHIADALYLKSKLCYGYVDPTGRVDRALRAMVAGDWVQWRKVMNMVDGYQKRMMEFGEDAMRMHALKCLGRSYLNAEKGFVERSAGREWKELVKNGVGWELVDGDRVVIRKPKVK